MRVRVAALVTALMLVAAGVDADPARDVSDETAAQVPVLLVPGWFDSGRELAALRIRLIGAGWDGDEVEALTFEDPTGSNELHADEVGAAVERLRAKTGADKVDIVAHSMGGLATRWYLMQTDAAAVRRVVFIASPHRGTFSAYLAWGEGRTEMKPGSEFLDSLNAGPAVPIGVEAITVRTPLDTHIIPNSSARLTGLPDYEVCCPTHAGLLRDSEVFRRILFFLEHGYEETAGSEPELLAR